MRLTRRKPAQRRVANPTRYQRETGKSLPRWRQKLADYAAKGGYFVHFSDVPKAGVYPVNKYDTPTGFYAYFLDFARIAKFANDRPHAVIFRPGRSRLWRMSDYEEADYQRDLRKLRQEHGSSLFRYAEEEALVQTPAGRMWNVTRAIAGGKVAWWTTVLRNTLGYDGVVDDCEGIIHENEKCQAVFFDTTKLDVVDVLDKGESSVLQKMPRLNLSGQDMSGRDLSNADLSSLVAIKTKFVGCDLSGTNLRSAMLGGADLSGSDLRSADMRGADLHLARLLRANLTESDLSAANAQNASFDGADLSNASLDRAHLSGASLRGSILLGTDFRGATMALTDLYGTDLRRANLDTAVLREAKLENADLSGTSLEYTSLHGAYFRGADLSSATLLECDLRYADLRRATLTGTKFVRVRADASTRWPASFDQTRLR